jgi:hypothetical protein
MHIRSLALSHSSGISLMGVITGAALYSLVEWSSTIIWSINASISLVFALYMEKSQ